MDCPTCGQPLTRTTYEDVQVMQCETCFGYLVARNRLRLIKSSRQMTPDALRDEAHTEQAEDTAEQIRCPKCRVNRMRKERVRVTADESFFLDVCRECNQVWFDGGELAKLQMEFEQSAKAVEEFAMKERLESRTEEQRAEFKERVAQLSESQSGLFAGLFDSWALGALVIGATIGFGAVVWLLIMGSWGWSVAASLVLCGLLALVTCRVDATSSQRIALLWGIGIAEAAFLLILAFVWFFF